MKKKLVLTLSVALVLSAVVCLFVFPTSADEPVYFDATAEANTIWDATGTKATVVTYNEQTIPAAETEASLSDLNIGFTGGTYTLVDGVLTLNNATTAAADGRIRGTNGSLKVVINGADFYGAIGNDYPPYGDLLITSETGNKIIVSDQNNAIRSSGNLVVYGNVGFDLSHSSGADAAFVIDNSGSDANQRMILCPEVDSSIRWEGGSAGPIRSSRGNVIIGGSAYIDIDGGGYYAFLTNNDAAKEIKFVGTGVIDISTVDENIAYASSKPTFSVSEDVTVTFDSGTATAFNGSTVNLSGNAKVRIISTANVLSESPLDISGNAKVEISSGGNATNFSPISISGKAEVSFVASGNLAYGGSLSITDDAKVSLSATSGLTVYGCSTTISGNAEVDISAGAGRAVQNANLAISDNAEVNLSGAGADAVFFAESGGGHNLSVSGNATLNLSGTATYGIFINSGENTFSVADSATVNIDVNATNAISLSTWAIFRVSGGTLNVMGNVTNAAVYSAHSSNVIEFTGGVTNLLTPSARAAFVSDGNDVFYIGKGAVVTGIAQQLMGAVSDSWLEAEALAENSASNISIISTNGVSCSGGEHYVGLSIAGLSSGYLTTNGTAASGSGDAIVKVTDANGTTDLSEVAPYYSASGKIAYLSASKTLYMDTANVKKVEILGDCNIIVYGTNVLSNDAENALWSAAGKTLAIYGPEGSSLSLTATTQVLYGDKIVTSGDFVLNGTATTGCVMEPGGSFSYGDYVFSNKEINITAAGNYAFCRLSGSGNLTFKNSKVTMTGGNSVIRIEGAAGNLYFDNCQVEVTASAHWPICVDSGNIYITDSHITSSGSEGAIIARSGSISIENSSIDATGSMQAIRATGNLTVVGSEITAKALSSQHAIYIDGNISISDSVVTATAGQSQAIYTGGSVSIDASEVIASAPNGSEALWATGSLSILNGSTVNASASSYALVSSSSMTIDASEVTATTANHRAITVYGENMIRILNGSTVTATAGSTHAIAPYANGSISIEDSDVIASGTWDVIAAVEGTVTVSGDSSVIAKDTPYYAVHAKNIIVKDGAEVEASSSASECFVAVETIQVLNGASVTVNGGTHNAFRTESGAITVDNGNVAVIAGTGPAINSGSTLTVSGGTVTATANGVSSENSAAVLINSGSLNVMGGVLTVDATLTGQNEDNSKFGSGICVNAPTAADGLNITGGEVIVETTANGAVGTSILIHNGLLNVGGGASEAKLAVYNRGSYSGYGSEASAAITLYPGTMNVQDNGKVYVRHQSYVGLYFLTREGMVEAWNTAAGLRVSGGQMEVYSTGSASIPFGQGQGINGAARDAFTDNYKYTGGVVLAHSTYPSGYYVYDTTFQSGAIVDNYVFVGGVGRAVGDSGIVTEKGLPDSFDRAGYSSDWAYWGNDSSYQYYNPLNEGSGVLVSGNDTDGWTFRAPATTTNRQGQYDVGGTVVEMDANQIFKVSSNPVVKMVNDQIAYISFDVEWSAMTFYYDAGTWNPSSHAYEGGSGWVHKVGDQVSDATVKVTNSGTVDVSVSLVYAAKDGYSDYVGVIRANDAMVTGPVNLLVGNTLTYTVTLNAETPTEDLDSLVVGTLTLSVSYKLTSYNEKLSHKFFATNTTDYSIQLYNLNRSSENWNNLLNGDSYVEWTWSSSSSSYKDFIGNGITAAKLRNSPAWGEVVISCSTGGWVGVLDYDTKNILFEAKVDGGPHDIEMLPNGDLAVIGSGGKLHYFPLSVSTSKNPGYTLTTRGGHGVAWDPANECLWILEDYHIAKVMVNNYGTANASLAYVSGEEIYFGESDYAGHVLSPIFGQPGKYWFSATDYVWIFDSETMTFELAPQEFQEDQVKGIAYFSDGTMIQTPAQFNSDDPDDDWHSRGLCLVVWDNGEVQNIEIPSSTDSFYKVFPATASYQ